MRFRLPREINGLAVQPSQRSSPMASGPPVRASAGTSGVPLVAGTDDLAGFMLHRELELYVQAGVEPGEAIRIATENGALHLTREGGHSHRRIVHVDDATGRAVQQALERAAAANPNITLLPDRVAIDLVTSRHGERYSGDGHVWGVYALNRKKDRVETFTARATILAGVPALAVACASDDVVAPPQRDAGTGPNAAETAVEIRQTHVRVIDRVDRGKRYGADADRCCRAGRILCPRCGGRWRSGPGSGSSTSALAWRVSCWRASGSRRAWRCWPPRRRCPGSTDTGGTR